MSFLLKQFVIMFPLQPFKITDKNTTLSGSQVTLQPKVVAVVNTITTQEIGSGFESPGTFLHILPVAVWYTIPPPSIVQRQTFGVR